MKATPQLPDEGRRQTARAATPTNEADQTTTGLLDAVKLASIAAQPRFARHAPADAAKGALELWQECQTAINAYRRHCREEAARKDELKPIPQPKQWPATLNDFLHLIVRTIDRADGLPRLRRFALFTINRRRRETEYDPCNDPGKRGPKPELGEGTEEALDAVGGWLEEYRAIEKAFWNALAEDYLTWWTNENLEKKRKAGRARALAHKRKKRKKKLAEGEGAARLVSKIMNPPEKETRKKSGLPLDNSKPNSAAAE